MSLANDNRIRPIRPQQYRLKWPLTPEQVENIDTMLETLFKATRTLKDGVDAVSGTATSAVALATGLIGDGDRDGNEIGLLAQPGATGAQGLIGATGPTMFLPQDAPDELPIIAIPGQQGPQGLIGASLNSNFEDTQVEDFDCSGPYTPADEYRVSAYGTAQQSIVTATFVAATLDAEDYKVGSAIMHDNATNNSRLVAPVSGYYLLTGGAQFDANATGQRVAIPKLNGTTFLPGGMRFAVNSATATSNALVSLVWFLTAGDYVEMMIFQDTGVNQNTGSASRFAANFFQINRLNFR